MNPAIRTTIPAWVLHREVGGETVLLDLQKGTYFSLDAVGARIWSLLGEGRSLGEVFDVLQAEYDVAREALEGDVARLVTELLDQDLLRVQ